ncbi:MAG: DUF2812 domain-containing protein [Romboutsia sp.]
MKKVFKPFWSYSILKIEKWLSKMASEGYILDGVNIYTRVFTFKKGKDQSITYKISYQNKGIVSLCQPLKREGWKNILKKNRWNFICNKKNEEDIKINPSRENLLKRNRNIKYTLWFILYFYIMAFVPILLILGFIPLQIENIIGIDYGAYIWQSIFLMFILLAIYTIVKLNKLDKKLREEVGYDVDEENSGIGKVGKSELVKKIKLGW